MASAGFVGRVGGLAAALGAGTVIGLAVAAPASADDSGTADSGSRGSSAQHSARSGHTGAERPGGAIGARRGSSPSPAATSIRPAAAVSVAAPKAVATPAVPARDNSTPVPAEPVLAAAAQVTRPAAAIARTTVATPVAAATPAAVAAPTASALCACDPRGRLITVYKGVHFVLPQSPAFFIKNVTGTGTFTANSVYDLGDVDQYDWNKFTGIVYSPLQHDKNSAMVGWRYNLVSKEFEIAPFYNVNKERILPNEQTEVISVPADGTFQYTVDYSGVTISYGDKTVYKPYPPGLKPNIWTSTRVSGWFGGNESAPRTLTYYLNLK